MGAQHASVTDAYGLAKCLPDVAAEKGVIESGKVTPRSDGFASPRGRSGTPSPRSPRGRSGTPSPRSPRVKARIPKRPSEEVLSPVPSERAKVQPLSRRTVQRSSRVSNTALSDFRRRRRGADCGARCYLEPVTDTDRIIVIGDLHGMVHKAKALWQTLEDRLGCQQVMQALVVFLGDYCDRGLYTKELLQWLLSLKRYRDRRGARTVCLLGNHEFCLLGFLGWLPKPVGCEHICWRQTWDGDDVNLARGERGRWWGLDEEDSVLDEVHLQGRRWAGAVYERSYGSTATFASYGTSRGDRYGLFQSMPEEHLQFLHDCPWVHVEDNPLVGRCVFVHAGLDSDGTEDCCEQIERLRSREAGLEPQPEQLFGRDRVLHTPPQLARKGVTVISGHHGRVMLRHHRIILDSCAGDERNLLSALVLPEALIVQQDGTLDPRDPCAIFPGRVRLTAGSLADPSSPRARAARNVASPGSTIKTEVHTMPRGDSSPLD
mmetsp:Transcript_96313/g.171118  ORF Transcript_96313/g.171118 Transcript_96313/m.171118 type:complete len:490 (+) Transcript_96313:73-1542(+)